MSTDSSPSPALSLTHDPDGTVILTAAGAVDLCTAVRLREHAISLLEARPLMLIICLEQVDSLDSRGLAALVAVGRRARELGIQLRLVVPAGHGTDQLLQITSLGATLEVCGSIDAARRGADTWIDLNPG